MHIAKYLHMHLLFVGIPDLQVMNTFDCNTNAVEITVRWDAANTPYCGGVLYYIVMISSDEHSNIMNDIVNVTVLTATFSNLRNDTNYNITVTAVNRAGAGMTTTVKNIRTSSPITMQRNVTGTYCSYVAIYVPDKLYHISPYKFVSSPNIAILE